MTGIENILNDAMNLRPSERALLAQQLINSLTEMDDEIEKQWLELSKKRLSEMKDGSINGKTWKEIKSALKKN